MFFIRFHKNLLKLKKPSQETYLKHLSFVRVLMLVSCAYWILTNDRLTLLPIQPIKSMHHIWQMPF
nr:MAG TPA: hypothetical protein [Caudoviricetes sp.]